MLANPTDHEAVNAIDQFGEDLVALRRRLHQYPELAFEEFRTGEIVAQELESLGLDVRRGVGGTGVVAILHSGMPGKTVMLRADMDGVAMDEVPGRVYGSTVPGASHCCGHDLDMAVVLGAARALTHLRTSLSGTVVFMFQPADEPMLGAARMLEDGLWEMVQPDYLLSQHVAPNLGVGEFVVQEGAIWASSDSFRLLIEEGPIEVVVDPRRAMAFGDYPAKPGSPSRRVPLASIASQIVSAVMNAVEREHPVFEPVMFDLTSLLVRQPRVGYGKAEIDCRLAVYSSELRATLLTRVAEVAQGVSQAFGASCSFERGHSIPPVINDARVTGVVNEAIRLVPGVSVIADNWRNFFADDLGLLMEQVPGCLLLIGTASEERGLTEMWHTPGFDIDEQAILHGAKVLSLSTMKLLRMTDG